MHARFCHCSETEKFHSCSFALCSAVDFCACLVEALGEVVNRFRDTYPNVGFADF